MRAAGDVFQSTYPHGVRRSGSKLGRLLFNFNPRTRTGYDSLMYQGSHRLLISIHVPARGTTTMSVRSGYRYSFQSTYPHGVRLESFRAPFRSGGFQSTYPHGVRPDFGYDEKTGILISIHVPARGTTIQVNITRRCNLFQSTYPHGVRQTSSKKYSWIY